MSGSQRLVSEKVHNGPSIDKGEGIMELCIHELDPVGCATCKHGVLPTFPKKKQRKSRQKPSRKAPVSLMEKYLQEYLSGTRCMVCFQPRTGEAMQCDHERMEIAQAQLDEIEEFVANNPDTKRSKLVQTASAAAISRVTLRAGLRSAASPIDGLSIGGLIGAASRASNGRAMEWRDQRPSGDPLPV